MYPLVGTITHQETPLSEPRRSTSRRYTVRVRQPLATALHRHIHDEAGRTGRNANAVTLAVFDTALSEFLARHVGRPNATPDAGVANG